MNHINTSIVSLTVSDDTSTTHVTTTSDHDHVSSVELDEISNFTSLKVKLDSIVDLDGWVWVTDGATVVSNDVWDTLSADGNLANFAKLVGGLFGGDTVDDETSLDVVQDSEVFI